MQDQDGLEGSGSYQILSEAKSYSHLEQYYYNFPETSLLTALLLNKSLQMLSGFIVFTPRVWRSPLRGSLCKSEVVPTLGAVCFFKRRDCVYFRASRRRKGRDYIRGNELSFQEVIMDLGLRARQTTWGERRGGTTGTEVHNVCTQ